jgi:hypothetical protein
MAGDRPRAPQLRVIGETGAGGAMGRVLADVCPFVCGRETAASRVLARRTIATFCCEIAYVRAAARRSAAARPSSRLK